MIFKSKTLNTLFSIATFPIWIVQGGFFKKIAIRLPEANGIVDKNHETFDFIMLGDSVAAGVGIEHIDDALAGEIAKCLDGKLGMPKWKVMGKSGYKLNDLLLHIDSHELPQANHYVVSIGVNDVKAFTSFSKWRIQINELINRILHVSPNAKITFLEVPPMDKFPLLKLPLSSVLGARCSELNNITNTLIPSFKFVNTIPIELSGEKSHFAEDGFHPSTVACQLMAEKITHFFD
ncbi:SGNH/GDSL hydrolase family protein [Thalassotalea sp. M1531]|uniref:SGNH/GDSL hydrolase family protein n=1 Tax=Thalassotalea algicola TaxID=2716224 RepID=A0A7Y0LD79_9GAMM|nr:SGNH/GDSL hydrolase family protein [Thalassotalea algicola]NMP32398.1 SGNH/GDSL hydrolase family protein [Thalassotalea algicola]